ncbi:PRC-barrel domain-containing protein [Methanobacterium petrolearium]|uniref:PRC-barrel domain-containing protein n=1 Tax=Methanobacterium petrolearium TaxID=710190 RepID=UPI003158C2F1|nr:sporulation protein YlmC with PRC-barrel domain [Methanobacterium petrolearium]BDZ69602.1 hypothetical protein GCM10025861_01190 [Methanobacterium petrolearium]
MPKINQNSLKISEKLSSDSKNISGLHGQIKEKLSHGTDTNDVSNQTNPFQNEYSHQLSEELEFAAKSDPYALELEKRFITVSNDLNNLDKDFIVENEYDAGKGYIDKNISATGDNVKLVPESSYGGMKGMSIMRIKDKIIGKEVVDIDANLIGKVKDVDVNFQNKTMEAFIIGKGGILEGLGGSGNDIIVPLHMVMAIGDKILINSAPQI